MADQDKIELFIHVLNMLIKYGIKNRRVSPRAQLSYSRDETDLIKLVRDSYLVPKSSFAPTLTSKCCVGCADFLNSGLGILDMRTGF